MAADDEDGELDITIRETNQKRAKFMASIGTHLRANLSLDYTMSSAEIYDQL